MINRTQEEIMSTWKSMDLEHPMVSVRCITYNHEPYIADALDGFLMQVTDFPFEVIVHDDASPDRTAEIIRTYEDKYPKIIKAIYETENQYSKHDGSLGKIVDGACLGKYIALCEGDDYWIDANKLQMQVDFLEKNPDYGMCFHAAEIYNMLDNGKTEIYSEISNKDYNATDLFKSWTVPTASIVLKKEVLNIKNNNSEKFICGDIVLVENCASVGKVRGFSKKMSVYRIQENGLTWNRELQEQRNKLFVYHYETIKKDFPLIKKSVVNDAIINSCALCIVKYGSFFDKIGWFIKIISTSPNALIRLIYRHLFIKSKKTDEKI